MRQYYAQLNKSVPEPHSEIQPERSTFLPDNDTVVVAMALGRACLLAGRTFSEAVVNSSD